jgi:acyl-ACP thioesterase
MTQFAARLNLLQVIRRGQRAEQEQATTKQADQAHQVWVAGHINLHIIES